jgi:hypothetical protein
VADADLIARLHPEWGIISAVDAPGGGVWATNARGEVFTTDQAGNPTSDPVRAPYFGGYTGLRPEQRQGPRIITAIQRNQRGGYTLISNLPGQVYDFDDPNYVPPAGSPGTAGTTKPLDPGLPAPKAGDRATVDAFLDQLGLRGLADTVFSKYQQYGASPDALPVIMLELRDDPIYKARFPGIDAARERARTGLGMDWSEANYLEYEARVFDKASRANLPPGMVNREMVGELLRNDWSVDEWTDAVDFASQAALTTPPETLAAMRQFWDVDTGSLTAYYLDPDRAFNFIEEQTRMRTAGIAGAATRTGFGGLSLEEATRLQQVGLTEGQATGAFAQAYIQRGLTDELLGETTDLTRGTQLEAIAGEGPAQEALERRRAQRQARFEGGGGSAGFGGQRSGLGSAGQ